MTTVPQKFIRTKNRNHLRQARIPDCANESFPDKVAQFSQRVMEGPKGPIYRVWSKLDPVAHSVILSELGCFDGKERAQRDDRAREVAAELKKHTGMLVTFLRKQAEHEYRAHRPPRFYRPHAYFVFSEGRCTLRRILEIELNHLKHSRATINRRLKKRGKWDVSGMVRAQEYVKRRAAFLGNLERVQLSPNAIADIYELTRRPSDGGDDSDTVENIRKAIAYFRKNPDNAHFIQNIEYYLDDWKKPISKPESGN